MTAERIPGSEIPRPQDKLVLFDLDKTLINPRYDITDEEIFDEIAKTQAKGYSLGLSSDTPLEPLKVWRSRLGMNGPIVAEKGSVLWFPDGSEKVVSETENYFNDLKKSLMNELTDRKMPFYHGDVVQFARSQPSLVDMVDTRLVLIQAYRRCSLNFFGKRINDGGKLQIDNNLTQQLVTITTNIIGQENIAKFDEDYNQEYGLYILSPKNVNKRFGTLSLMQALNLSQIAMIGDSKADILGSDIALHYSVGNASQELKDVADYQASQSYTSGVVEILKALRS